MRFKQVVQDRSITISNEISGEVLSTVENLNGAACVSDDSRAALLLIKRYDYFSISLLCPFVTIRRHCLVLSTSMYGLW